MLNELNIIARGLLGLHGYAVDLPRSVAQPAERETVAATSSETRVRAPAAPAKPQSLALHAQGSR